MIEPAAIPLTSPAPVPGQPTESRATPASWRLAALTALFGGLGAGDLASRGGVARSAAGLAVGIVAGYVGPILRASRRPPISPGAAPLDPHAAAPTFSIVVGARDEAAVVARLVADVAAQDHRDADGRPRFELILVDDRSVDGTAHAAQAAAEAAGIGDIMRVVRRNGTNLPDGKGAALTAAPPDLCRGDVVVVLDADARIERSFLRRVAAYVAAGAPAMTGRRRLLDAGTSWLAGAQADEQTLDGEIQRGRWSLGGCSEFRGNGIVVRRDLLEAVGGWRAEALTEDLDLSSRIAAQHGVRVGWALDAEVWEEPVRDWPGLWRQRVRWAEGGVRRVLEHGPSVVRSRRLSPAARLDFAAYTGQLLVPSLLLGAAIGGVRRRRPAVLVAMLGTFFAASGILAFDALRWETDGDGRPLSPVVRGKRAVRVSVFGGLWLFAVPAALWRLATRTGAVRYDKMVHQGAEEP